MKKRFFALVLTILMAISIMPMALAAETPPDQVDVPANIYVRKEGTDASWTAKTKELTMSKTDMTKTVDFTCVLTTAPIKNAIIAWYEWGVENVIKPYANGDPVTEARLMDLLNTSPVTGNFTVTIEVPSKLHVPAEYTADTKTLVGFNATTADLFVETGRTFVDNVLTIGIAIKDGVMEQALYDGVVGGTYLNELTFTVEGVTMDAFTVSQTVTGKMEGSTLMRSGRTATAEVEFSTEEVRATLKPQKVSPPAGGDDDDDEEYKLTFNVDGKTDLIDPIYGKGTIKVADLPKPTNVGYKFDGWYFDSAKTNKVDKNFKLDRDMTLYGHFISTIVDTENHFAYVIGYPDETVRPAQNITREEVATIFYRLLRDEVRDSLRVNKNDFTDVADDRWSNVPISTMANGGFIKGYPDGTFGPGKNITRAEFATMATRFASLMDDSGASFSDIAGHWSESYVLRAATAGWIAGYPDGTFGPEKLITRAEAMTIINRVLMRSVNKEGLHADTMLWIDMDGSEWYYYITLEATNSHNYTRQEDGINENWTAIIPNKTWD